VSSVTDVDMLLVKRSQEGDVAAFEQLIKHHQVIAYNIAFRVLGNQEDAQDATQEALIKVFKNITKFKAQSQFSTWLYRIVVNTCRDYARKNRKVVTLSTDSQINTEEGQLQREFPDESMSPELLYEKKELSERIQLAISTLPEQNRTVVVLRDIQGLSYEVIASILDIPVGTVKSRINRGRDMLKQYLLKDQSQAIGLST
jgi:RNA polymerase sigma-70 factor (ECF subfamily)